MLVLDELRVANWQRSKSGAKNRNRPKRISPLAKTNDQKIGGTDIPQDEVRAWLKAIGPAKPGDDEDTAPAAPVVINATTADLTVDPGAWNEVTSEQQ